MLISAKVREFARGLLLASACTALSCAPAAPDENIGAARSPISGGEADSKDTSVFLLVSHRGKEGVALCSASLIAPNLLLTARHCVSDVTAEHVTCGQTMVSAPFPVNTFYASNSLSLDDASTAFRASSVSVPTEGSDICGFDIALITLETPVPASVATPLVPRIDLPVQARESYSAVGYGQTAAGDAGAAGQRRVRSGLLVNCVPGKCGPGVESNEFVGDTGICSGDSGGPALDAAGKVVGVVSRSGTDCAHPVYGAVASWKDWLSSVAAQAAEQGRYAPPFWVGSGLSDPPLEAGVLGMQGDKCSLSADCQSAFGCFSPTRMASDAYCAAYCKEQAECPAGTNCQAGVDVCVVSTAPTRHSSSCSLGAAPRPESTSLGALLALATLSGVRFRRRNSRARQQKLCFGT